MLFAKSAEWISLLPPPLGLRINVETKGFLYLQNPGYNPICAGVIGGAGGMLSA